VLVGRTSPLEDARRQVDAYLDVDVSHIIFSMDPANAPGCTTSRRKSILVIERSML
jgi:hypothetical protein